MRQRRRRAAASVIINYDFLREVDLMRREREREREERERAGRERRLRIAGSMGNFEYERKLVPRRALMH